ncbi:transcriptional regulator [Salinisphaera sp. PC39]|uniref:helix-turn-helix domain-containing protein n=1 Tax=Salinisphaera sp. PC39 TaxID=1304156 RepID=UPI00334028D6
MSTPLRVIRKRLGLTLDALARSTGLTKSYLSKVERGLNTPSIAVALKLAEALDVSVEELFSEGDTSADAYSLVRADERRSMSRDGGLAYASLARHAGRNRLLPFVLYPQAEFGQSAFKEHVGEEFVFVHRGRVEVDFMSERLILECGDALHFNAQMPHRIRSVGDETAELLVVVAGEE